MHGTGEGGRNLQTHRARRVGRTHKGRDPGTQGICPLAHRPGDVISMHHQDTKDLLSWCLCGGFHLSRAAWIFSRNFLAVSVTACISPGFAGPVSAPPTATPTAPALIQSDTLSRFTPPVGRRLACGRGPRIARIALGPNNSPGKSLTMSAPHSMARSTSSTVIAPGIHGIW